MAQEPGASRVGEAARSFQKTLLRFRPVLPIVFVCGGASETCHRAKFLRSARKYGRTARFFLAEKAYEEQRNVGDSKFIILSTFEQGMAEISHAILLFPESVGSYAETGLFSAFPEIRRKVLIAQPRDYQTVQSFLSDGPIHSIARDTLFGKLVLFDSAKGRVDFSEVYKVLSSLPSRPQWRELGLNWSELPLSHKVGLIQLLFEVFPYMTYTDIVIAIEVLVGEKPGQSASAPVAYLTSLGGIRKDEHDFYHRLSPLYEFDTHGAKIGELRLSIRETYTKSHPMHGEFR